MDSALRLIMKDQRLLVCLAIFVLTLSGCDRPATPLSP